MLSTKPKATSLGSSKKIIINELKLKHAKLFKLEKVESPKFFPKASIHNNILNEKVIPFYIGELKGGDDIYIEFVNMKLEPEDSRRTLWKWPFNSEFDTEYLKTEPHLATGLQQYLIPVAELIDVAEVHSPKKSEPKPPVPLQPTTQLALQIEETPAKPSKTEVELFDAPLNQMTIKDKAAIDWKLPISDKPWLNELITKHFK